MHIGLKNKEQNDFDSHLYIVEKGELSLMGLIGKQKWTQIIKYGKGSIIGYFKLSLTILLYLPSKKKSTHIKKLSLKIKKKVHIKQLSILTIIVSSFTKLQNTLTFKFKHFLKN